MIKVNIKLFSTLRRHFPDYDPHEGIDVELGEGSTVQDLLRVLDLSQKEARVVFCHGTAKRGDDPINHEDELKIFTQICGG